MKQILATLLLVSLISPAVAAQPQYGDLVITTMDGQNNLSRNSFSGYLNPSRPGIFATLAITPASIFHNWVRMAPNNMDMVLSEVSYLTTPHSGRMVNLQPNGVQSIITTLSSVSMDGFELDHDGQWVASARSGPLSPKPNYVLGVDHATGATTIFASLVTTTWFNEIAIDRDPGSMPYVITDCCLSGPSGPEFLLADRQGTVVTLVSGTTIPANTAIELDPRTGDYIVGYLNYGDVIRMTKTGKKTTLTSFSANAIRILQDDTAWMAHGGWKSRTLLHYHLSQNTVLSLFVAPVPYGWGMTGLEVYGSRTLVCNQKSPSTVTVNVQSRFPGAGGKLYALAASFARRPGIGPFPNGEYLNLDATNPLFYLSALGMLPSIFQNFQGTLNPFGDATANVDWSSLGLPPNLGISVFVAGVIFGRKQGVIQVTNTHWFVL